MESDVGMIQTSHSNRWPKNTHHDSYEYEEDKRSHDLSWDMWSKPLELSSHQCESFLWNMCVSPSGDVIVVEGPPSGGKWLTIYSYDGLRKSVLQPPDSFRKEPWFPWDVAVLESGDIVVSEEQSKQLLLYDKNGRFERTLLKFRGSPAGLAVNSKNEIIVSDIDNKNINTFTSSGKLLHSSKKPGSLPRLLCPLRLTSSVIDDTILVSDCWLNCVKVFDQRCNFLYQIGCRGSRDCQFLCPGGIATNREGCTFIADELNHRIQVIAPHGHVNSFLVTDCDGLQHPRAVAIDTNDNLVIGEWSGVVKRFQYLQ